MSIFLNTEDLVRFLPINGSFTLENLTPFLDEVETSTLSRHITPELYADILGKVDTNLTENDQKLLEHCKRVVVPLAVANYLPFGEVQISDVGITTVSKSADRTAAYAYQVDKIEQSCFKMGFNALENLIGFLERNATLYPFYENSPEREENKRLLISSAVDFSTLYPIFDNRLTYYALRPTLSSLQDEILVPALSAVLFERLKVNVGLDEDEKAIRDRARKWLAFRAIMEVIQLQLSIELNAGGVRINYGSMFSNAYKYYTPPSDAMRSIALETATRRAAGLWSEISSLLDKINGVEAVDVPTGILTHKATILF